VLSHSRRPRFKRLVIVTAVLALVAPGAALVMGILLALAAATALADSFGAPISWFDIGEANERERAAPLA
jgi:hypothetical protein